MQHGLQALQCFPAFPYKRLQEQITLTKLRNYMLRLREEPRYMSGPPLNPHSRR